MFIFPFSERFPCINDAPGLGAYPGKHAGVDSGTSSTGPLTKASNRTEGMKSCFDEHRRNGKARTAA
jgi:hypothetical protein